MTRPQNPGRARDLDVLEDGRDVVQVAKLAYAGAPVARLRTDALPVACVEGVEVSQVRPVDLTVVMDGDVVDESAGYGERLHRKLVD